LRRNRTHQHDEEEVSASDVHLLVEALRSPATDLGFKLLAKVVLEPADEVVNARQICESLGLVVRVLVSLTLLGDGDRRAMDLVGHLLQRLELIDFNETLKVDDKGTELVVSR
jgi:hypothetical protein